MGSGRGRRFGVGGLGLLFAAMLTVAGMGAAAGAAELSREESLEALKSPEIARRRQGAERLALAGQMEDMPSLLGALGDPDPDVRSLAERSIWNIWGRSGDPEIDRLFGVGLEQMQGQEYLEAIDTFSEIIRKKPDFAEGWNKRATLYYMIGALEKSLADCDEVVKRNPVHFGALAGYGMIFLRLDRPALALQYFERALAVNPNMAQIETAAEQLRRQLDAPRGDRL